RLAPHANHNLGVQYTAPSGAYLSLAYAGTNERTKGNTFNTNRLEDAEGVLNYASNIERNETNRVRSLSLNYGQDLDSLGSRLFVGGQYVRYATTGDNPISERGEAVTGTTLRELRNLIETGIEVASAQIDYTKVFPSGLRLETGLRHGAVDNRSDFDFSIAENGQDFRPSAELSSLHRYREGVSAAYASVNGRLSKQLSYGLGLRSELTDYRLQLDEGGKLTDRYVNVFPNASLLWSLPDGRSLNLTYVARINRPPFRNLNPNLIYQDPYTSIQGNPELLPERTHAVELTGKHGPMSLKVGYTYTTSPMGGSALPGDTPRSYVLKRLNFSEAHAWYAAATHTLSNAWWSATTTLSVTREQIYAYEFDFRPVPPRPQPYLFTNHRFTLGKLAKLEALFYYVGELREGTFTRYDNANLTLTLEKAVFEDKLLVRFTANDLFNTVRASGDYRQGETDIYFDNKWRSSYLRLSLRYDFGRLAEDRYRNEATGRAEGRRAQ
ncbi:MAG: outer membrane beta-barrel family protein, partial [Bacteroidota bacterium]